MILPALVVTAVLSVECTDTCRRWNPEVFPEADSYSDEGRRTEWLTALHAESKIAPTAVFGAAGHLMGLGGMFPLPDESSSSAAQWALDHAEMLGIPAGATLQLARIEKFFEFKWEDDVENGVTYRFVPFLEGLPFEGNDVVITLVKDAPYLRGVYTGLRPTSVSSFASNVSSTTAWNAALEITGSMRQLSAQRALLDLNLLLTGVPQSSKVFWSLVGRTANGVNRQVYVDAETGVVGWASSERDNFDIPRKNYSYQSVPGAGPDVGQVVYSAIPGQTATFCTTEPSCTFPAATESHRALQSPALDFCGVGRTEHLSTIAPAVIDAWYQYSVAAPSVPAPQTYPGFVCQATDGCFAIPFPATVNFESREMIIVASNFYKNLSGATNQPPETVAPVASIMGRVLTFTHRKNQLDLFGHEYGHYIDRSVRGATSPPPTNRTAFDYAESIMDVFGESSEGLVNISRANGGTPTQNNFSLNACSVYECPTAGDPYRTCQTPQSTALAFRWTIDNGDCGDVSGANNGQRKAFGRTYYGSWQWLENTVGSTALAQDYRYYFRAWMSNILRSHFMVKRLAPNFMDLYAATASRVGEAGVAVFMQNRLIADMEQRRVGINGEACFR